MLDQPHNAQILINLKCALTIVPYNHKLTSLMLINALKKVLNGDGKLRESCFKISQIIEEENVNAMDFYVEKISSQFL